MCGFNFNLGIYFRSFSYVRFDTGSSNSLVRSSRLISALVIRSAVYSRVIPHPARNKSCTTRQALPRLYLKPVCQVFAVYIISRSSSSLYSVISSILVSYHRIFLAKNVSQSYISSSRSISEVKKSLDRPKVLLSESAPFFLTMSVNIIRIALGSRSGSSRS